MANISVISPADAAHGALPGEGGAAALLGLGANQPNEVTGTSQY
jgi:hypothetical protein